VTVGGNLTGRLTPEVRAQVLDLIRLIKELRAEIEDLKARVTALEP
jgi:hypothetical protein